MAARKAAMIRRIGKETRRNPFATSRPYRRCKLPEDLGSTGQEGREGLSKGEKPPSGRANKDLDDDHADVRHDSRPQSNPKAVASGTYSNS